MKERKKATKLHQPTRVRGARDAREPISARARSKAISAPAPKAKKAAVKKAASKKAVKAPAKPVKNISKQAPEKAAAGPKSPGRKSSYSADLGDRICELIADGVTWAAIEKQGLCSRRTLATWIRTIPDFHDHYARAREARAEFLVSELEIAIKSLDKADNHMTINAVRVQTENLRWMISSYYPRMYGQKVSVEVQDSQNQDLYDYSRLTEDEIKTLLSLMDKALVRHDDGVDT